MDADLERGSIRSVSLLARLLQVDAFDDYNGAVSRSRSCAAPV